MESALHIALRNMHKGKNKDIVEMLLLKGADMNAESLVSAGGCILYCIHAVIYYHEYSNCRNC